MVRLCAIVINEALPPMPHRIRLFAEQTAYLAAGGQVSSAGVFLRDYRGGGRVLIPFAALGFEKFVSDYRPGAGQKSGKQMGPPVFCVQELYSCILFVHEHTKNTPQPTQLF